MTAARRVPQVAVDAAVEVAQWSADHTTLVANLAHPLVVENIVRAALSALVPSEWFIAPAHEVDGDAVWSTEDDGYPVVEQVRTPPEVWALLATLVPAREET